MGQWCPQAAGDQIPWGTKSYGVPNPMRHCLWPELETASLLTQLTAAPTSTKARQWVQPIPIVSTRELTNASVFFLVQLKFDWPASILCSFFSFFLSKYYHFPSYSVFRHSCTRIWSLFMLRNSRQPSTNWWEIWKAYQSQRGHQNQNTHFPSWPSKSRCGGWYLVTCKHDMGLCTCLARTYQLDFCLVDHVHASEF